VTSEYVYGRSGPSIIGAHDRVDVDLQADLGVERLVAGPEGWRLAGIHVTRTAGRHQMFGLFKRDPLKTLKARYAKTLEQARDAQRNGNLALYGALTEESERIDAEIVRLEAKT